MGEGVEQQSRRHLTVLTCLAPSEGAQIRLPGSTKHASKVLARAHGSWRTSNIERLSIYTNKFVIEKRYRHVPSSCILWYADRQRSSQFAACPLTDYLALHSVQFGLKRCKILHAQLVSIPFACMSLNRVHVLRAASTWCNLLQCHLFGPGRDSFLYV